MGRVSAVPKTWGTRELIFGYYRLREGPEKRWSERKWYPKPCAGALDL